MAVQTQLFTDETRATMRNAERALAADLDRIHDDVGKLWDRATRCHACGAEPDERCRPTCETNRAR